MLKLLENAFPRINISKFSGGACPQTPPRKKWPSGPLWDTGPYFSFSVGYSKNY